jgi:hypothetical protein
LTIVVQNNVRDNNKFIDFISKHGKENVDIRLFNNPDKKIINHFAVMDESGYRFEIDDKKMKAVANFGDKKVTDKLYKIFDYLYQHSEGILPVVSVAQS